MQPVTFSIPDLPPTRNGLYYTDPRHGGMEWRKPALQWKALARPFIPPFDIQEGSIVRVDLWFYYKWFTKSGNWVQRDDDNLIKCVIDTVSKKIGVDDRRFKRGSWGSEDSNSLGVRVTLTEVQVQDWRGGLK